MNAITTPACWCGTPATMTVPIDPTVTPWDGETRQSDGSPALAVCDEHARDGYERLELSQLGTFQLGSWTNAQLYQVRATAIATDDENEALVVAIDAELEERVGRQEVTWEQVHADRERAEAIVLDRTATVLADLIFSARDLAKSKLEALLQGLPRPVWLAVAGKLDLCPVHVCDIAICEDDEDDECQAEREGLVR